MSQKIRIIGFAAHGHVRKFEISATYKFYGSPIMKSKIISPNEACKYSTVTIVPSEVRRLPNCPQDDLLLQFFSKQNFPSPL